MERNENGQFAKGSGIHDLTKQRFGQLEVIELAEIRNRRSYWLCKCDCGNTKVVLLYQGNLYDKFKEDRMKMQKLSKTGGD